MVHLAYYISRDSSYTITMVHLAYYISLLVNNNGSQGVLYTGATINLLLSNRFA